MTFHEIINNQTSAARFKMLAATLVLHWGIIHHVTTADPLAALILVIPIMMVSLVIMAHIFSRTKDLKPTTRNK